MRLDTIGTHQTKIMEHKGAILVSYHNTVVVEFTLERVVLDTGGYFTVTTKRRMNQASRQFKLGYSVFQKDYKWFCKYQDTIYPFIGHTCAINR